MRLHRRLNTVVYTMSKNLWRPSKFNRPTLELSLVQCCLAIAVLAVVRAQPRDLSSDFVKIEQFIGFLLVMSSVLLIQAGDVPLIISIIGVLFAIISVFVTTQPWASAVAAACFYISLFSSQSTSISMFAQGAAGAYYSYVSVLIALKENQGGQNFIQGITLAFCCASTAAIARQDFAGAIVQLVFFALSGQLSSVAGISNIKQICLGASIVFTIIALSSSVTRVVRRFQEGQSQIRKLQSHAVMNAYVTMK